MRPVYLLLILPVVAGGEERILDYHSDILVRADGWLEVTEYISVLAEGDEIRRGIFRDYPTRYEDHYGNDVVVAYEPRFLTRNGTPEPFHTERLRNGIRAYFGSADRLLEPGVHNYAWRYDAGRMLGYFESRDELYWNVTGLGWAFPIDRASASIEFAFDVTEAELGMQAFTGSRGEQGRHFRAGYEDGKVLFVTTRPLALQEGLTVVVDWPKGLVAEPDKVQRFLWLMSDNANLLAVSLGLMLLLAYYLPVWRVFGRDPAAGVVVVRYEPPPGFSPASLRYVRKMRYDDKTMTAAIVNLAVKGYLRIETQGKKHLLRKQDPPPGAKELAPGERELLGALFGDDGQIELERDNHQVLGKARARHRASLRSDYANRYFRTNGAMNLPAALIFVAAIAFAAGVGSGITPAVIAVILLMVVVMTLFAVLLKRPTGLGRKLLDETEGFREYLDVAEKDDLNLRNPPRETPALFEAYLPYALALDVEQQWAERFASKFADLQAAEGSPYHPSWYGGSWDHTRPGAATAGFSNGLSGAISSSVSAPGSSSGSGGSSGGGGGGGGGGGW